MKAFSIGNGWFFKYKNRTFVWPFLFSYSGSWGIIHLGESEHKLLLILNLGRFHLRIPPPDSLGGSMRTTSFRIQWMFREGWCMHGSVEEVEAIRKEHASRREIAFCWRPDVTHYYWVREPGFAKKKGGS
jgi:hypothetical protein